MVRYVGCFGWLLVMIDVCVCVCVCVLVVWGDVCCVSLWLGHFEGGWGLDIIHHFGMDVFTGGAIEPL